MAALATKTQSQKIFEKLKSKPANKVQPINCPPLSSLESAGTSADDVNLVYRYALTAMQRTPHGHQYPSASISAWIAVRITETLECTSRLCAQPISTVCGKGD